MRTAWYLLAVAVTALLTTAPGRAEWSISGLQVRPRLDVRAEGGSGLQETLGVEQAEIDISFSVNRKGEEVVAFALSPNLKTAMEGRARQMHFSNYYSVWNFGVDRPKLRLGQFVIPFGTLAEYDTHPLVLQTPYARTLGVRIDRGLAVTGQRGEVDYSVSLTTGDGRRRTDGGYAAAVRLARDFERGDDAFRVGVSALHGKQMPMFPVTAMPMPMDDHIAPMSISGHDHLRRADKQRLAVDLDWLHGIDNIRAEMVLGRDDGQFVHGQWLSWNRPLSYETDITLQADRWQQRDGVAYGFGVQVHHRLDEFSGLRVAYQPRRARPDGMPGQSLEMVTIQWYRDLVTGW